MNQFGYFNFIETNLRWLEQKLEPLEPNYIENILDQTKGKQNITRLRPCILDLKNLKCSVKISMFTSIPGGFLNYSVRIT